MFVAVSVTPTTALLLAVALIVTAVLLVTTTVVNTEPPPGPHGFHDGKLLNLMNPMTIITTLMTTTLMFIGGDGKCQVAKVEMYPICPAACSLRMG